MLQQPFLLNQLLQWVWGWMRVCLSMLYYTTGWLRFDVLSVSKVESTEQRVVFRGWLAGLILVQEDRWASHFHAQLLDSLLVVNGQQEGLEARLGANCGQDGEVLRKNTTCTAKEGGVEKTLKELELLWHRADQFVQLWLLTIHLNATRPQFQLPQLKQLSHTVFRLEKLLSHCAWWSILKHYNDLTCSRFITGHITNQMLRHT